MSLRMFALKCGSAVGFMLTGERVAAARAERQSLRRRAGSERGAQLVEFALALPLLMLAIVGAGDIGLLLMRQGEVANAAREGARIRSMEGYTLPDARERARLYLAAARLTNDAQLEVTEDLTTENGAGGCFDVVSVTVRYPADPLLIDSLVGLFGGSIEELDTLSATASMRAETVSPTCP